MKFITCADASERTGISVRRIQQMCKNGEISGAVKQGKSWAIPLDTADIPLKEKRNGVRKPLPVGISDYKTATSDYYYVDKTLLIKDFLDKRPKVSLFTRPRRFGKTLNMDMLRVFFEKTEEELISMLKSSDGKSDVVIYLDEEKQMRKLGRSMSVDLSGDLAERLSERFGKDQIKVTF